jgi:hypothetical protein
MRVPAGKAGRESAGMRGHPACCGIISGSIQPTKNTPKTMEAERINALSALLNDLSSREAELRRYL